MQDPNYPYGAQIQWSAQFPMENQWNDIAIWALDFFGLPGDRYITDLNINDMTWWFQDPHDQTLFVLRNGETKCIKLSSST